MTAEAGPAVEVRPQAGAAPRRGFPPVAELAVVSMVLTIPGVVYLAANQPDRPSLAPVVGLVAASGALLAANVLLLARIRELAWRVFRNVFGCALAGYLVIAGMIEFVFVYDGTRGGVLVLMTLSLALFTINVPLLLAFFVAKHQSPGARE